MHMFSFDSVLCVCWGEGGGRKDQELKLFVVLTCYNFFPSTCYLNSTVE